MDMLSEVQALANNHFPSSEPFRSADHDWIIISSSDGILALGENVFYKSFFSKFNGMHFVSEGPVKQ